MANKFRAKRMVCPHTGEKFDSQSEYARWQELKLLEMSGQIRNLCRQVRYPLACEGRPILLRSARYKNGRQMVYVADFAYEEWRKDDMPEAMGMERWHVVTEDRKGYETPLGKAKIAFFEAQYQQRVRIT